MKDGMGISKRTFTK